MIYNIPKGNSFTKGPIWGVGLSSHMYAVLGAAAAYGWDTTMNHSFVLGFVIPFG
jgi:hypothetical protein